MGSETNLELLASDIRRQPELVRHALTSFRSELATIAGATPQPRRIYLVGCGDSLNVGMTVRFEWERLLGMPVQALPALTFSRYEARTVTEDALVVALSQSGTVVRVVEALRAARSKGATTIAITSVATSPLGIEPASAQVITSFPKLGFVPGTTAYPYHLAIFYELGLALAESWGSARDADRVRDTLTRIPELIERSMGAMWDVVRGHAGAFRRDRPFLILGAGPNFPTALFIARKMFEVPQVVGLAQETEEYAHDEYSIVTPEVPALLIAPRGAADVRNREILQSLVNLGTSVAVVGDASLADACGALAYPLEEDIDEYYTPLLASLPGQMLTHELGRTLGGSYYASDEPIHRRDGDDLIYRSELVIT